MESREGERRPGAVTEEALNARAVLALDADGSVYTEPARPLPGEHAGRIDVVEEAPGVEVAEHAALDDALELDPVDLVELGGLMEVDRPIGPLAEDSVEDDEVEMKMRVEGGAEAVEEGYGAQLSGGGRAWAGAPQGPADGTEEDPQDGAGDLRVVV